MQIRTKILGTACALALGVVVASPAMAQFSATLDGEYANISSNHGGGNLNEYGGNASGMFNLGSSIALQGDVGYHNFSTSGLNADNWNIGGAPMWNFGNGRIGANVSYDETSASGTSLNLTRYGGFGEWFATSHLTLAAKVGGFSGNAGVNGTYAGGQVTGYLMPDLSLAGSVDYASLSHSVNETDYTARAEYLISESTPVSIFAGYTYSDISGAGAPTFNTWMVGLKFYCNGTPATTLVDRQRQGDVSWAVQANQLITNF